MARLDEGEDPTPLVENFLPAILPALRLGLRVAGRPRVVRFLAQYLGRLIAPYVGPTVTPGLSRAIVDAGLRAMTLEARRTRPARRHRPSPPRRSPRSSRTRSRGSRSWTRPTSTDEALVEEAAYTAFHESAAANFPAEVLSPQAEYLESGRAGGTWVSMPRTGPWRYRKYSRVFNVVIHPAAARAITHVRRPAAERVPPRRSRPQRTRSAPAIHLYQAVPGSTVARIARAERGVAGLGSADARARSRLHPLTPMAAAALIGEPGLGSRGLRSVHATGSARSRSVSASTTSRCPTRRATPSATGGDTTPPTPAGAPRRGRPGGTADAAGTRRQPATGRHRPARAATHAPAASRAAARRASSADAARGVGDGDDLRQRGRRPGDRRPGCAGASRSAPSLAALRRIYGPALGSAIAAATTARIRSESEDEEDEVETEDYSAVARLPDPGRRAARPCAARCSPARPMLARQAGLRRSAASPPAARPPPAAGLLDRPRAGRRARPRPGALCCRPWTHRPTASPSCSACARRALRALLGAGGVAAAAAAAARARSRSRSPRGRLVPDERRSPSASRWRARSPTGGRPSSPCDDLDNFASPDAWSRLERYLGQSLAGQPAGAVDRLARDGDVLAAELRAAETADELELRPAPRGPLPAAVPPRRDRARVLRGRGQRPLLAEAGGPARRVRHPRRTRPRVDPDAARQADPAGPDLRRQGARGLDPARRAPAVGRPDAERGRRHQAHPAQPERTADRAAARGRPPDRVHARTGTTSSARPCAASCATTRSWPRPGAAGARRSRATASGSSTPATRRSPPSTT